MRNPFAKPNLAQDEINRLLDEMSDLPASSDHYQKNLDAIQTLSALLPKPQSRTPSADTIISSLTNLMGIGAVLHYEKLNVVTSKAFGWIKRS